MGIRKGKGKGTVGGKIKIGIKQGFRKGKRNYKWYMKMETERGNVL